VTSTETTSLVIEVLHEVGRDRAVRLTVADQVAVAQHIGSKPPFAVTATDVTKAFERLGLDRPTGIYAKAVVAAVRRLGPPAPLLDVLVRYRKFAIRSLSRRFGGRTHANEGELRDNLLTYLPERGYSEVPTGRGRTDIIVLRPLAVIEVKVWESRLLYEDGIIELGKYIHTEGPDQAAMVIFGEAEPLPPIITDATQAIAEHHTLHGLDVPVVVIPFEVDAPSKAGRETRKRNRGG
jgi:hypothetical protein